MSDRLAAELIDRRLCASYERDCRLDVVSASKLIPGLAVEPTMRDLVNGPCMGIGWVMADSEGRVDKHRPSLSHFDAEDHPEFAIWGRKPQLHAMPRAVPSGPSSSQARRLPTGTPSPSHSLRAASAAALP